MSAQSPDRPIETAAPPTPSLVNEKQAFSQEQAQPIDERSSDLRHRDDNAPILPVTAPKQEYELTGQPNAQNARWNMESIKAYLMEEVDTDGATGPLSAFCFMTVSFWFVTGLRSPLNYMPHSRRDMFVLLVFFCLYQKSKYLLSPRSTRLALQHASSGVPSRQVRPYLYI